MDATHDRGTPGNATDDVKLHMPGINVFAAEDHGLGDVTLAETGYIRGVAKFSNKPNGPHRGIMVYIPGTDSIAMTDDNGNYYIRFVPPYDNYTVVAHCEGYDDKEIDGVKVVSGVCKHDRRRRP